MSAAVHPTLAAELDDLEDWVGRDPAGRAARAAEIERDAADEADRMRARLIRADVAERSGELKTAAEAMWLINEWAHTHGDRYLIARSHLLLGRTYRNLGDVAALLVHAVAAVEALEESVLPRRRLPYVVKYADALTETGSIEAARERYRQAEELARHSADLRDQMMVLNNHAYAEYLAGEPERAWTVVRRMRATAAAHGHRLDPNDLDTVASVQIALGHYQDAEETVLAAINGYPDAPLEADALPEFLLTLAITRRLRDDLGNAQLTLDACREQCEAHGHGEILVRVMQEQAELHAAAGAFEPAFAEYKRFHAAEKEVLSAAREAQARNRQALFEVNEARQEAEQFREQARRDPLTGLRNRRYVDEQLPGLIEQANRTGVPLWAAVLDLDHFKQINDLCTHEAGDRVLVEVARLLTSASTAAPAVSAAHPGGSAPHPGGLAAHPGGFAPHPGGFAARLGGEEFLLVVSGLDEVRTVGFLERVRATVAGHPWRAVTGDLPVTVSIGADSVMPGDGQAELLARADARLYAAKRAGRNRVIAGLLAPE
ncbi:GGDEF domain-containing protein [Actinoplanes sp. L3-i22]|uniref:GGDEF domain-containing protein n=1 Tax=Actinoplanes sp. L3-i22 TaxID=2836373 RepID=UPI001C84840B|nr:GGDEF domain-containing protein [Actinoplanes sp. L3-i22]